MKHLLQSVSQGAVDDESSNADTFTSDNGTFTPAIDNLLYINNGLYYFEEKSVKNDAVSVFIVA